MTADGVETRAARPEEADDLLRVLCAAFGLSFEAARPLFYADPFFDLGHKRVLRTPEDGVASCLTVIPTRIRVGGAWVPMGGIAGVATRPECRGRGYAGRLLAATVPALEVDLGYPIAGLSAHSEHLYRRFGWETVSQAVRHTGLLADLPAAAEAARVRPLTPSDVADRQHIRRLHTELAQGRTGACARDSRRWRILEAAPERRWVLYQGLHESPSGYAVYESSGGAARILEMHGATPAARRGLLSHLSHLSRQANGLTRWDWVAAPEDISAFGLASCPRAGESAPGLMLRLTDTAAALAAVHAANLAPALAESGRTLTVRAVDTLRPENARPVQLSAAGVGPGAVTDRDWIAADVRVLAQFLFGYRAPSDAHAQGALQASSSAALTLADALFPARAPFVAPLDQF